MFFYCGIIRCNRLTYKFEIIITDVDKGNRQYCFKGKCKYYLMKGDTMTLQYYENTDYFVKATVFDIQTTV